MLLDYSKYTEMGGTLEESAFNIWERNAEYLVRSQAGGQTGKRIDNLTEVPEAVKDCIYDLISFLSVNPFNEKQITSESQNQGGVSESYSYTAKTDTDISQKCIDIIEQYLYGGGLDFLLYRGAYI